MSLVSGPFFEELAPSDGTNNVLDIVENVLAAEREELYENDMRRSSRFPYTQLVELTYIDTENNTTVGRPITVAARNLSLGGMGFFHNSPLPLRTVSIQLQPGSELPPIVTKLVWCRCSTADWYEHGAQFCYVDDRSAE